jgi:hypothetical protein
MSFTKAELEKLKAELPRGATKEIGEKLGFKQNTVSQVLNGTRDNMAVILLALEVARKHQQQITLAKKAITELSQDNEVIGNTKS